MTHFIKRIIDFLAAEAALVLLSPVMLVVALLIRLTMGSPVFFRQTRPGYKDVSFDLIKFRTMSDQRDIDGNLLPDEDRLTRIGRLIRSLSIDELPQLWNILKGDMSIIGPRPLLVEYLDLYNSEQHRRHDVLPGIVGWTAVNGRNANTWEKKLELDIWYIENWSLWLDIKIFFMAIVTVLKREGISQDNETTASKFTGTSEEKNRK